MGVIYKHTNKINGHMYIGYSTYSMEKRWKEHIRDCKCVNHKAYNTHFYNALRKYGPDVFDHELLEECSDEIEVLKEREKYWIAYYNTYEDRDNYNLTPGGDGGPLSEETKRKIGEGNKGKKASEETRKKLSESRKGENHPMFGKQHSEDSKKKISEAKKGITHSEETRKKMSEARKGENNPLFGKPRSEETCKKISESLKGKKPSEETCKKISEAKEGKTRGPYKKKSQENILCNSDNACET
jgi:group I intron endonuclease